MNSILPVYYQIKQTIKNWIINREYGPGSRIPSENQLATHFKVNRLTVRQALSQLAQEGFLVRKRGKGTFVTGNEDLIDRFSLEFSGFMDDLFYQVQRAKTESVSINQMKPPNRHIQEKLDLMDDTEEVTQILRVRFFRGNPFAYTINYLPTGIGKKINKAALYKKPLLQIMEQELHIKFVEALQTIEASFADQEVADLLGVAPGMPILFVERTMYTTNRRPVELVQTSYRGDLYKYIVRLRTMKGTRGNLWIHDAVA